VHPPLLGLGEDLGPDVVGPVENVARVEVEGSEQQGEAVGPLATATAPRFEQLLGVVVAGKSRHFAAFTTSM